MASKKISLPDTADTTDYKPPQLQDVISFMVARTEGSNGLIGTKLQLCLDVLSDDQEAVDRVCNEFSEDVLREIHGSIKKNYLGMDWNRKYVHQ